METKRRNLPVYGILIGVWVLIVAWQVTDHIRVQNLARAELIHRARDVSTTVATTVRLLRRFGGVVSKERLESALTELLRPGEWDGIARPGRNACPRSPAERKGPGHGQES